MSKEGEGQRLLLLLLLLFRWQTGSEMRDFGLASDPRCHQHHTCMCSAGCIDSQNPGHEVARCVVNSGEIVFRALV